MKGDSRLLARIDREITELDIQIAESKQTLWFSLGTLVGVLLALIPGFPGVSAALVPSVFVSVSSTVVQWRRRRAMKLRRAAEDADEVTP